MKLSEQIQARVEELKTSHAFSRETIAFIRKNEEEKAIALLKSELEFLSTEEWGFESVGGRAGAPLRAKGFFFVGAYRIEIFKDWGYGLSDCPRFLIGIYRQGLQILKPTPYDGEAVRQQFTEIVAGAIAKWETDFPAMASFAEPNLKRSNPLLCESDRPS